MAKYVDTDKLIKALKETSEMTGRYGNAVVTFEACIKLIPPADVVSMGVLEQVRWERDVAIDQLNSYGVGFAEKADVVRVVRCKDCVHCVVREYDIIDELECEIFDVFTDPLDYCSRGERKADND